MLTAIKPQTKVQFVQAENSIVAIYNGESHIITNSVPYFEWLCNVVKETPEIVLLSEEDRTHKFINTKGGLDKYTEGGCVVLGEYYLRGKKLGPNFAKMCKEAKQKGVSLDPFLQFLDKAENSPAGEALAELVMNREVEITWQGDIVLYTRAAWGQKAIDWKTWIDENVVTPLTRIFSKDPMPATTFQGITGSCNDQGSVFDILVNPEHVVSVGDASPMFAGHSDIYVYSSEYQVISKLGMHPGRVNNQISVIYRQVDDNGVHLVRAPFNNDSARGYLEAMLTSQVSLQPVKGAQLTGSC